MKNIPCRPLEHLRSAAQLYPAAWAQLDAFWAVRRTELPDWPEWCFCPLAGSYAIVSGGGDNRLALDIVGDVSRIGALAAWRQTKGIYRFDPVLAENLLTTKLSGDLPVELLYRLPEWCVYVETPDHPHGFFAHLEHDSNTGRAELRFLFDFPDWPLVACRSGKPGY